MGLGRLVRSLTLYGATAILAGWLTASPVSAGSIDKRYSVTDSKPDRVTHLVLYQVDSQDYGNTTPQVNSFPIESACEGGICSGVLTHDSGKEYFVWATWADINKGDESERSNIYTAKVGKIDDPETEIPSFDCGYSDGILSFNVEDESHVEVWIQDDPKDRMVYMGESGAGSTEAEPEGIAYAVDVWGNMSIRNWGSSPPPGGEPIEMELADDLVFRLAQDAESTDVYNNGEYVGTYGDDIHITLDDLVDGENRFDFYAYDEYGHVSFLEKDLDVKLGQMMLEDGEYVFDDDIPWTPKNTESGQPLVEAGSRTEGLSSIMLPFDDFDHYVKWRKQEALDLSGFDAFFLDVFNPLGSGEIAYRINFLGDEGHFYNRVTDLQEGWNRIQLPKPEFSKSSSSTDWSEINYFDVVIYSQSGSIPSVPGLDHVLVDNFRAVRTTMVDDAETLSNWYAQNSYAKGVSLETGVRTEGDSSIRLDHYTFDHYAKWRNPTALDLGGIDTFHWDVFNPNQDGKTAYRINFIGNNGHWYTGILDLDGGWNRLELPKDKFFKSGDIQGWSDILAYDLVVYAKEGSIDENFFLIDNLLGIDKMQVYEQ